MRTLDDSTQFGCIGQPSDNPRSYERLFSILRARPKNPIVLTGIEALSYLSFLVFIICLNLGRNIKCIQVTLFQPTLEKRKQAVMLLYGLLQLLCKVIYLSLIHI